MLAPVSPAPASLPWALPIPLAGFSPVCKDLEMGDLPSVPPPPLPGSHWTPPSPAWGEWGWAVAVYPLSPFSTPTVKPLGGAGDGKGILLTLPGEAGWSLAPPPALGAAWAAGTWGCFKASPKTGSEMPFPDLGVRGFRWHQRAPAQWPLPGVGAGSLPGPWGLSRGFCSFFWDQCPPVPVSLGSHLPPCPPPPCPELPSSLSSFVHQMFHLKK